MVCSKCGSTTHNARTCPQLVAVAASHGTERQTIPASKMPDLQPSSAAEPPAKPKHLWELFEKNAAGAVEGILTGQVIPWVDHTIFEKLRRGEFEQELPGVSEELKQGRTLATIKPLKVRKLEESSGAELSSYKPGYELETAKHALETAGVFEGVMSLFAMDATPSMQDKEQIITGIAALTWKALGESMKNFEEVEKCRTRYQGETVQVQRTMFPVTLASVVIDADALGEERKPLLWGHQYVYAWYLSMLKALEEDSKPDILRLLQCALTPTVQIRAQLNASQKAAWSIQLSNQKENLQLAADSFPTIAAKAWVAIGLGGADSPTMNQTQKLKALQALNLRFSNLTVNKAMVAYMEKINDPNKVNAKSLGLLRLIETSFGREVLNTGYVKLKKLIDICEKEAALSKEPVAEFVQATLEYIYAGLTLGSLKPGKIHQDTLEGTGGPGIVLRSLAIREIVVNVIPGWVADLPEKEDYKKLRTSLSNICNDFYDYRNVLLNFAPKQTNASGVVADNAQGENQDEELPIEKYVKELGTKAETQCAETLYEITSGQVDNLIEELVKWRSDGHSLSQVSWCGGSSKIECLKELERQLCLHKNCVNASSTQTTPPEPGSRTLKRLRSEAEDEDEKSEVDKERKELWEKAQSKRRKIITTNHFKDELERSVKYYMSQKEEGLSQGSAHRLVVFSADCFAEAKDSPWKSPNIWVENMGTIVKAMLDSKGSADVVMACDGRSRTARRHFEDIFDQKAKHFTDMWTVFTPVSGKGRRVFMGSDNREVVSVELPIPRTSWAVEAIHEFQGSGEQDTHCNSMSGVTPLTWWQMPLISNEDKKKVLGHEPQRPPAKAYDASMGQPLFWNERKTIAWWKVLLKRFKIKRVINFSPGSAMLERACLDIGVECTAVCKNATHANWVLNVLDRAAMASIVSKGSVLYDADMKSNIERLFQDIIDRVNAQDNDDTEMPETDETPQA